MKKLFFILNILFSFNSNAQINSNQQFIDHIPELSSISGIDVSILNEFANEIVFEEGVYRGYIGTRLENNVTPEQYYKLFKRILNSGFFVESNSPFYSAVNHLLVSDDDPTAVSVCCKKKPERCPGGYKGACKDCGGCCVAEGGCSIEEVRAYLQSN